MLSGKETINSRIAMNIRTGMLNSWPKLDGVILIDEIIEALWLASTAELSGYYGK